MVQTPQVRGLLQVARQAAPVPPAELRVVHFAENALEFELEPGAPEAMPVREYRVTLSSGAEVHRKVSVQQLGPGVMRFSVNKLCACTDYKVSAVAISVLGTQSQPRHAVARTLDGTPARLQVVAPPQPQAFLQEFDMAFNDTPFNSLAPVDIEQEDEESWIDGPDDPWADSKRLEDMKTSTANRVISNDTAASSVYDDDANSARGSDIAQLAGQQVRKSSLAGSDADEYYIGYGDSDSEEDRFFPEVADQVGTNEIVVVESNETI
jgi:hypothetical protein